MTDNPSPSVSPPKVASGVEGLDHILVGGFPQNRFYLIEGEPGSGKTTLGLQFLLEGARLGEPGLYVTLSETADELRAVALSHAWSLEGVTLYELTAAAENLNPDEEYTILHPSEVELSETVKAVFEEVERINPKRVVFDSLSEMRLLARDPLRYRRQILGLKQFFAGRDCTVLLLDDRTSEVGDLQLQSISHGVVRLECLPVEYGAERRRLRIVKLRGVHFRGGYHDFQIVTGGIVVFPRLVAADHHQAFAPGEVASGVAELDALFGGGLLLGTSVLLMGPAGAGKSVVATQYAIAAAERGDRAAIYGFDEGLENALVRADGLKMPLRSHVAAGRIAFQPVAPAELSPGEFVHRVRHNVERDGARVVIIDSLNGYLAAMPEERSLLVQLHELLTYLDQQGVLTVMSVAQHGLMGTAETPIDVSYLADAVVLFRYFEVAGEVRQALSVMKMRTGRHERTIRELRLGPGIRVGPPLTQFDGVLSGVPRFTGTAHPVLVHANTQ